MQREPHHRLEAEPVVHNGGSVPLILGLLIAAWFCGSVNQAQSQGSGPPSVGFSNRNQGPGAPVFDVDCTTLLSGPAWVAQLYAGPPGASAAALLPVGTPTSFLSGSLAGYWRASAWEVPFAVNREFTVQARVFPAAAGSFEAARSAGMPYGMSNILLLEDPGLTLPPPDMYGLQSFCLVPEPTPASLMALVTLLWLILAYIRNKT